MKHKPTPHARRVAALRYQAEQLLRDAEAWGCIVGIDVRVDGKPPSVYVVSKAWGGPKVAAVIREYLNEPEPADPHPEGASPASRQR